MKPGNIFPLQTESGEKPSSRQRLIMLHEIYHQVSLKYHFEILRVDYNPDAILAYRFVIEHLKLRIVNETRWMEAS